MTVMAVLAVCTVTCEIKIGVFYISSFFFFNDTATTEIYTLSLHDALPICALLRVFAAGRVLLAARRGLAVRGIVLVARLDRKSTRLNSSHLVISYAVFCLKKKK